MPEEDLFNEEVEVATDVPESAVVNEYRSKITIGDVETLDYSEDAYVTNTGTAEDPILNFGLPKGASGTIWGQLDGTLSDQLDLQAALDAKDTAIGLKADIDSPALTGTPTAPTAVSSTNNTQIATTAFVQNAISVLNTTLQNYVDTAVANVLKRMNFSNAVNATLNSSSKTYTCPNNGYVFMWGVCSQTNYAGFEDFKVNNKTISRIYCQYSDTYHGTNNFFFPVTSGDKISADISSGSGRTIHITFVPMR